ncbi:DinB family protein [Planctomonas deserti]|uniref:DinB family protein n=1 Tax=Planctomonas deserti TaxID=2144185 RepID=UPI000D35103D|nr:DinB family protein [Planctomonas deserti]
MPITPDQKDWTWVLTRTCPECGFDAAAFPFEELPRLLLENAQRWPAVLGRDDVRARPDDSTWSALEYGAHVRDVYRIFAARLQLMLTEDDPAFENWDQDATAEEDRYGEQDPAQVAAELTASARLLSDAFAAVPTVALGRTGLRSDGSRFTVETLGRYLLHDPVHHLHDVHG